MRLARSGFATVKLGRARASVRVEGQFSESRDGRNTQHPRS